MGRGKDMFIFLPDISESFSLLMLLIWHLVVFSFVELLA